MAEEKALRYDTGKVGLEAILGFPAAMVELARVTEYGERKYARHNFRKGAAARQSVSCALRHLLKWSAGEENDPESGIPHLAHAAWNVLRLLDETLLKPAGYEDDRHILEPARREILAAMIGGVVAPATAPETVVQEARTPSTRCVGYGFDGRPIYVGDKVEYQHNTHWIGVVVWKMPNGKIACKNWRHPEMDAEHIYIERLRVAE